MTIAAIALTLAGQASFTRRDLTGADGVPVVIKKGETILVTEQMAEQLSGDDYGTHDNDNEFHPWFKVAAEDAKVTHDFVNVGPAVAENVELSGTVTHDLESLPKTESVAEKARISRVPTRAQRTQARAK